MSLSNYGIEQVAKRINKAEARRVRLDALQKDLMTSAIKLAEVHEVDKDDLIWTLYDIASILER